MQTGADHTFYEVQFFLVSLLLVACALALLLRRLARSRPDFTIGRAVVAGLVVRLVVVLATTAALPSLRGTDEQTWLEQAAKLVELPWSDWLTTFAGTFGQQPGPDTGAHPGTLHVWLFAFQIKALDAPELAMRVVQVGFAVGGLILLAAAVHDLASPRAAKAATWIMMLEPSNVFWSGFLHKEPLLLFCIGLVAFGGARLWAGRDLAGVTLMTVGTLIAVGTRPYAGWLLLAGAGVTCAHAAVIRRRGVQRRSVRLVAVVAVLLALGVPAAFRATAEDEVPARLQTTQELNAANNENLNLEPVDYSDRASLVLNLPGRMSDVLLRPYPWELTSPEQRAGIPGTFISLGTLALLIWAFAVSGGSILRRAGPLIYPAAFLLVAFSLVSANAGSAFRVRTHVMTVAICVVAVLWHWHSVRAKPDKTAAPTPVDRRTRTPVPA